MGFKGKFKNFFNLDEEEYEYEMVEVDEVEDEVNVPAKGNRKGKEINVVLCETKSYDEAQDIADNLLNKRTVIVNLQRVDSHQAKRIIDFLSGTVYAVNGDIQKLGLETFLCAPENVDVSGAITKTTDEFDGYGEGW